MQQAPKSKVSSLVVFFAADLNSASSLSASGDMLVFGGVSVPLFPAILVEDVEGSRFLKKPIKMRISLNQSCVMVLLQNKTSELNLSLKPGFNVKPLGYINGMRSVE